MERELPEKPRGELAAGLRQLGSQARCQPTPAERIVWARLRDSRLAGYKFRQQYRIENYRVDFYCAAGKLVIELDGPIHAYQTVNDSERQTYLERFGYKFLRFKNEEVASNLDEVLKTILKSLDEVSK